MEDNKNILKFLELAGRLKHIPRTGWLMEDVKKPETIAGHMYRMAIMSFLIDGKDTTLNKGRCMELALVHDLAECIVGDITPHCGISHEEKHIRELKAMEELGSLAGFCGDHIVKLFKEYEEQTTPEARFVKDLDRFDMILQAFEYEKEESRPGTLQQFFDSTRGTFSHPFIVGLVKELYAQRNAVINKKIDVNTLDNNTN